MIYFVKTILLLLLSSSLLAKDVYVMDAKTLNSIKKEYGLDAKNRVLKLLKFLNDIEEKNERQKLTLVNDFFNDVAFNSDMKTWNLKDYWATREEFLGVDEGDCEDYVIAKYFSLRQLGVSNEKIFLTYVKAIKYRQSHMVLTYYETLNSVPLVLDNINKTILPSTQRRDLKPLFNFNGEKIYMAKQRGLGKVIPQGKINLSKWSDLVLKIKKEKI